MDLALKADAFLVETESEPASIEGRPTADASRVRLILEGSRTFAMDGGAVLTPGLELGLRHDGGDAETGTGVELGGRVSYTAAGSWLSMEASVRTLVAHEASGYEEWGASGAVRLAPGASGRGLSFSLAPTWGAPGSGAERLWSARDARGLSPDVAFEPESRLEAELVQGELWPELSHEEVIRRNRMHAARCEAEEEARWQAEMAKLSPAERNHKEAQRWKRRRRQEPVARTPVTADAPVD